MGEKKQNKTNQEFTSRVPELTSPLCSSGSSFQTLTRADHRCSKCLSVSQPQRCLGIRKRCSLVLFYSEKDKSQPKVLVILDG